METGGLNTWVPTNSFDTSSLTRVGRFPQTIGDIDKADLSLIAARNEQTSGQLAVLSDDPIENLSCTVSDLTSGSGEQIPSAAVDTRYVGFVPLVHALNEYGWAPATFDEVMGWENVVGTRKPDLIGDPLFDAESISIPEYRAQPIWFTFDVPENASPGTYEGTITVDAGDQGSVEYTLELEVYDVVLPDPADYEFYLDIWMNPYVISKEYSATPRSNDVALWSDRHWELVEAYMDDLAERGQKSILTTIMHEPWQVEWLEGTWRPQTEVGFESMVEWRYDGQVWSFDFSIFDEYVETGLERGLGPTIAAYSMLVFRGPQRITYVDEREGERVVWKGEPGDPFWTEAWTAFLKAFEPHLEEKSWLEHTYIAFDERPEELMQEVINLIDDVAPSFSDQIQIAGSMDVEDIADVLAPTYGHLPIDQDVVDRRRENGKITNYYTAGGAVHPNTLTYSPVAESRMIPWISALNDLDGYLRWAYNSWPSNIYEDPLYKNIQGTEYFVYPGEDGPVARLAWEQLTEGIEDYELVHMLRQETGGDTETLGEALELATRNRDAREKDLRDLVEAKEMVLEELENL